MVSKHTLSVKLGRRLSQVRIKQGITQESLAHKAGLNRAYIGYIERGERNPSSFTMYKISNALKINLSELFKI